MKTEETKRLYAAEQSIPFGAVLTLKECRQLAHIIMKSGWWQARSAIRELHVIGTKEDLAQAWIDGGVGYISLGKDNRCELTMMHELAHIVTGKIKDGHNAAFAGIYLETVRKWMGGDLALELEMAFQKNGVVYSRAVDNARRLAQKWSAV